MEWLPDIAFIVVVFWLVRGLFRKTYH